MFDSLVPRYDLLNDVLSLGLDRRWRRAAISALAPNAGDRVLDLGCGTGKMTDQLARRCTVVGLDLSFPMLERAFSTGSGTPSHLVQGSAFRLPFREGTFTGVASAFVLRNLHDLDGAFGELFRVLSPGGRIALVDITEPHTPAVRRLFDAYFRVAAPAVGALVGRRDAYRYLVRSLAHLPSPEGMAELLRAAGFRRPSALRITGGIAMVYTATRPAT
jgi:demethylmenaquinone methyltransferase / 2-methoxy-6-polyprenyl-1,4-benzoquinol methylase